MRSGGERSKIINNIKTFFGVLADLVYPRRCPVCDGVVNPFGGLVCEACKLKFRYIEGPVCLKCGKRIQAAEQEYCGDCANRKHLFDSGKALFDYKSVSDSLYRFKYKGRQEYAAYYAQCMAGKLGGWMKGLNADALVPVPIHKSRRHTRGYNQAEVLAKELGNLLGIPVRTDLIQRTRKTAPMKDLSASERQINLKKAFKIRRNDVKLSTIIIIDDIYTTGSTIDNMSYELRRAGIKRIYFATLAVGRGF